MGWMDTGGSEKRARVAKILFQRQSRPLTLTVGGPPHGPEYRYPRHPGDGPKCTYKSSRASLQSTSSYSLDLDAAIIYPRICCSACCPLSFPLS